MYKPTNEELITLEKDFTYHPPTTDQVVRMKRIRDQARELCHEFLKCCPKSRERSLAVTKLEDCIMWANASIVRNENLHTNQLPNKGELPPIPTGPISS